MPRQEVTVDNLGTRIFQAAQVAFGQRFSLVKNYLRGESEKLAITLRMIMEGVATGDITKPEAKILLNQQKLATMSVLTAAEGMTLVAAQAGINAGLKLISDFVNGRLGFKLL